MFATTPAPALLALMLTACALTPEQQAARAAAQQRAQQALQVHLASQCDADTAALMREQYEQRSYPSEQAKRDFEQRYQAKINNTMFQACYKMAWQNYLAQRRLERIEMFYDDDDWFFPRPFYRSPFRPIFW